ncbi:hypothetical protein CRYUN_Cryun20dG0053500 [Craigia yunnanensis]
MENRTGPDIDDDFSEIYKEYTGPPWSTVSRAQDGVKENKRSDANSDEEEDQRDPNAVPTDFTNRETKVWEAKSKATERNWKKRKEEEMICKICGESGHFTQGCPSTLGANSKSQDFFRRGPLENHMQEKAVEDRVREDLWKFSRGSPQGRDNIGYDYGINIRLTLDKLELEYEREGMELGRIHDKEEDEENDMHQEQAYSEYDGLSVNAHYTGANLPMDSRGRYPNPMENYPSRPHDSYGEFQHQRREDFGKAYNQY